MEALKTDTLKAVVEALAEKAKAAKQSGEAMQYTQAALNMAHAAAMLSNMK